MGSIIASKVRDDGKIVFEVCVSHAEALQLKGHVDNISLVPLNIETERVNVVQRGTNDATTYFLVPKTAREKIKKSKTASFQTIKTPTGMLYIYNIKRNTD